MRRMQKAPLTRCRIGVLMGGRSSEREISLKTGQAVHQALLRRGYDAVAIDVDDAINERLRGEKIEVAFIALHGPGGEDGSIQGLLETLRIPYTGSGIRASAVAMHKGLTKTLLATYGIPVPDGIVIRAGQMLPARVPGRFTLPLVVKPASEGSTIGVTIVRQAKEWREALSRAHRYDPEAVVEAYIPGRELTVSILSGMVLPAVEIVAPGGFYDFNAKYQKGQTQYLCPAMLSRSVDKLIKQLALKTYDIIGCDGAARVDVRLTSRGKPYVLEINTIPGMTETSLLPKAAAEAGIDYDTLTERILASAIRRMNTMVRPT